MIPTLTIWREYGYFVGKHKNNQHSSHILIVLQALYWAQGDLIVNKIMATKNFQCNETKV